MPERAFVRREFMVGHLDFWRILNGMSVIPCLMNRSSHIQVVPTCTWPESALTSWTPPVCGSAGD